MSGLLPIVGALEDLIAEHGSRRLQLYAEGPLAELRRHFTEAPKTADGSHRSLRGGSWFSEPWVARASDRYRYEPSVRSVSNGFRCARPIVEKQDTTGTNRVLRGGGWCSGAPYCRSACRYRIVPGFRIYDFGFRCAKPITKEGEKK